MYRMQICFGFKNFFFFFLRPNLEFWPVFTETSEIFSKWNRNTLDKVPEVTTVFISHIFYGSSYDYNLSVCIGYFVSHYIT